MGGVLENYVSRLRCAHRRRTLNESSSWLDSAGNQKTTAKKNKKIKNKKKQLKVCVMT